MEDEIKVSQEKAAIDGLEPRITALEERLAKLEGRHNNLLIYTPEASETPTGGCASELIAACVIIILIAMWTAWWTA
jgi:hypothetical protein